MSNIDPRNIKRGRCMTEKCDCCEYQCDQETKIPACYYCGCMPTKHARIEDESGEFTAGNVSASSVNDTAVCVNEKVTIESNRESLNSTRKKRPKEFTAVASSSKTTDQCSMKDLVPTSFAKNVLDGLANNNLTSAQECVIIRAATNNMASRNRISNNDITQMAFNLLENFPVLDKSVMGTSQEDIETRIRRCIKRRTDVFSLHENLPKLEKM
ncbi:uncharacterized protein LOC122502379 [Leptopilina heterotoma]|uniref:uncharacterized protein LOC122502379 n=1 Tax=Leptopilina heterotoma TaxID=63436 RepID=UPI001CAA3A29|nr:uncharacterized protein LOC122502379 [Leptopilina heterotoma]